MEIFKYGQKEIDYLKKKDKKLGKAIDEIGKIEREVTPDLFESLIHSIVAQQISAKAVVTIFNRMQETLVEITPETIFEAEEEKIQKCGLSMRKAVYIKGIGDAVYNGHLKLDDFPEMSDAEIIKRLSELNGIGVWTAEMLLIFSMERPDIVSFGDLAILRGMRKVYGLETLTKEQFEKYKKRYSPYGSVASLYLWAISKE